MKVLDFGISRATAAQDRDQTLFDAGSLGALTPVYASPEQLLGLDPDPKDDIYALGCVVYELLSGKHPFAKIPANQAADTNLKPEPIAGLSRTQFRAIERALAFDPDERLANPTELIQALVQNSTNKRSILALVAFALAAAAAVVWYISTTISP